MRKRLTELDGLRALAILAVFARHALGIRFLWIGVDIFFILSAFLITGILMDLREKSLGGCFGEFYRRRVRRILPPYLLLLVVISFVFGLDWTKHWYLYIGLTNFFSAFHANWPAVDPLWSLGVEEQFYLVWPFAVYFLSNRQLVGLLCAILFSVPLLRAIFVHYDTEHWFIYKVTIFRLDDFAVGGLMTFAWRNYRPYVVRYGYLGLIAVVLTPPTIMVLAKLGGFSTMDGTVRASIVTYGIATACAAGCFTWALGGKYAGILRTRAMVWLGRISYTFYLIHMTMITLAQNRFGEGSILSPIVAFVASTAFAAASWYFMERHILHGGRLPSLAEQPTPLPLPAPAEQPAVAEPPVLIQLTVTPTLEKA